AIIAILAALLLPALNKGKLKATGAVCLGNQKQLALAFTMYAADNSEIMPGFDFNGSQMWGGGFWYGPVQDITKGTTVEQAISIDTLGLRRGPLWPYDWAPWSYHCPGDMRFKMYKPGESWAFDSYSKADGMNGQMVLIPPSPHSPFIKLTQVKEVSRAMVFAEE